jgi:hypothetical protein
MPEDNETIEAGLKNITYYRVLKEQHEESAAKAEQLVQATIRTVRKFLERGVSTGDHIRDLVLQSHGLNEEFESRYRALEEKLKGKRGEFVLIRYPSEVRERFGGDIRSSDFRHEAHFRIGVLAAEKLRLSESGTITLPIDRFLQGVWPVSMAYLVYPEEEMYEEEFFQDTDVEDRPHSLLSCITKEFVPEALTIGDKAVLEELEKVRDKEFFKTAAEKLGRLVLEPTD